MVISPNDYEQRVLFGATVMFHNGKIDVPTVLQAHLLEWYHDMLLHPGADRIVHTISQHFTWASLRNDCAQLVRLSTTCQHYKSQQKHYGLLPPTDQTQRDSSWTTVAVDLIGPWLVPRKKPPSRSSNDELRLTALTIIDLSTHLMELVILPNKDGRTVALAFDEHWLCRYPRPLTCIHDAGSEFMALEFQELLQSYGIRSQPTTTKNPQANAVLECTHQVIGNLLRSTKLLTQDLETVSDLQCLMAPVRWAINTTYHHMTLQATPGQLAFQRNMIMPTTFLADWAAIQYRRQHQTLRDNTRENDFRIATEYRVGDRILIRHDVANPILGKLAKPTEGPFRIMDITSQVNVSGTILIERRNIIVVD